MPARGTSQWPGSATRAPGPRRRWPTAVIRAVPPQSGCAPPPGWRPTKAGAGSAHRVRPDRVRAGWPRPPGAGHRQAAAPAHSCPPAGRCARACPVPHQRGKPPGGRADAWLPPARCCPCPGRNHARCGRILPPRSRFPSATRCRPPACATAGGAAAPGAAARCGTHGWRPAWPALCAARRRAAAADRWLRVAWADSGRSGAAARCRECGVLGAWRLALNRCANESAAACRFRCAAGCR